MIRGGMGSPKKISRFNWNVRPKLDTMLRSRKEGELIISFNAAPCIILTTSRGSRAHFASRKKGHKLRDAKGTEPDVKRDGFGLKKD
jgi:hypothetical protein